MADDPTSVDAPDSAAPADLTAGTSTPPIAPPTSAFQDATEQPSAFATATQPDVPDPSPTQTPDSINRTAQLATVALSSPQDLITQQQSLVQKYRDMITTQGDTTIRQQAAQQQQATDLKNLASVMATPTSSPQDVQGAAIAARQVVAKTEADRMNNALETQATTAFQRLAATDPTQARVVFNNASMVNPDYVIAQNNAKYLILQAAIDKMGVQAQHQDAMSSFVNFLIGSTSITGIGNTIGDIGNVDLKGVAKSWYDSLVSGQRINSERGALWGLDPADFDKYLNGHLVPHLVSHESTFGLLNGLGIPSFKNPDAVVRALSNYQNGVDTRTFIQDRDTNILTNPLGFRMGPNAQQLADSFGMFGPAEVIDAARLPGQLIRGGAAKVAAEVVAGATTSVIAEGAEKAAQRTGLSLEDIEANVLPKAVNPLPSPSRVSIQAMSNDAVNSGRETLSSLISGDQPGRLFGEEAEAAAQSTQTKMSNDYNRELKDVNVVENRLTDGSTVREVHAALGRTDGHGFADQNQARRYAQSIGLQGPDETTLIPDESGQWFVHVAEPVTETGFFTRALELAKNRFGQYKGTLARAFEGSRELSDLDLQNAAQVSSNNRARIMEGLKEVTKPLNNLNGAQRANLDQVLFQGNKLGVWHDEPTLNMIYERAFNRLPADKEVEAYQAARRINDVHYTLQNDALYKPLQTQGFKTVSFDAGTGDKGGFDRVNAKVNLNPSTPPIERLYVVGEGHYAQGRMSEARFQSLSDQGHALVTLQEPRKLDDGTTIKQFMVRKKELNVELLKQDQLAYRPGGRLVYKEKYFGRQAKSGVQPDTGTKFMLNPDTHMVGTRAEAKFWSERMEAARQAVNDTKNVGAADIDAIFGGHAGFEDGQSFIDHMNDGTYSREHPFEFTGDRELPQAYKNLDPKSLAFVDPDHTGMNGYLMTTQRPFISSRGAEMLKDWQGATAPVVDSYKTINDSLSNIASLSSLDDYKTQAVQRWDETFRPFIDSKSFDVTNGSGFGLMEHGKFRKDDELARSMARAGETQRSVIQRILGHKTPVDREFAQAQRDLENFVMGDTPGSPRHDTAKAVIDWWDTKNPVIAAKGLAFDMKLGLFNVGQFPLQIGTLMTAISVNPEVGFKAMLNLMPLRAYITRSGTDAMLDMFVQRGVHKANGMEAGEWMEMMRQAKKSGFFDVGGSHTLTNNYGPNAAMSNIGKGVQDVRDAARFFFNEGELWNRAVAWRIGWDDTKKMGITDVTSTNFKNALAGNAEKWAASMSNVSQAAWQKGVLSIPTQFWAYNARMMEMMLGKQLSAGQKMRFVLGQTVMFGSAGLPLGPLISDYVKRTSMDPNSPVAQLNPTSLDSFYGGFDRGLIDEVIYHMTGGKENQGMNIKAGQRYGVGGFIGDEINNILGTSQYGTTSPLEMAIGATGSTGLQFGKTMMDVIKYSRAEGGLDQPLTRDALVKLGDNISGFGNVHKAIMIHQYGTMLSTTGNVSVADLPAKDALAAAFGLQNGAGDVTAAVMGYDKHKNQIIADAAKQANQFYSKMVTEGDKRADLNQMVSTFMQLQPPELRAQIYAKIYATRDKSLNESLVHQHLNDVTEANERKIITGGITN